MGLVTVVFEFFHICEVGEEFPGWFIDAAVPAQVARVVVENVALELLFHHQLARLHEFVKVLGRVQDLRIHLHPFVGIVLVEGAVATWTRDHYL